MKNTIFEKSKSWIHQNARPLDLARFCYHFENGSKEAVIDALQQYQNEDGGFGHALEADCFNPNSSPIQTWAATEILWEVQEKESFSPIIKNIIKYLDSGKDFDGNAWRNTIPSNDLYPRASWWNFREQEEQAINYNPTIALAGFVLMHANQQEALYKKCIDIVNSVIDALLNTDTCNEMHTLSCFVRMTEYCRHARLTELFHLEEMEQVLREKIVMAITEDTSTWKNCYVCKPSQFIRSKESVYYKTLAEIAEYECKFIESNQLEDGTWSVNWAWDDCQEEWHLAKNWWKADIIIKNILFLDGVSEQYNFTSRNMIRKLYCVNLHTK